MNTKAKILPEGTDDALKMMIKITEKLMFAMDDESRAMVNNDARSFSMAEGQKLEIIENYEQAVAEFQARRKEFKKSGDKSLIIKLDNMNTELRDVANSNVTLMKFFTEKEEGTNADN